MMHAHLHGGKWSEEEERYAAVLIDAFKAGVLSPEDIEEVGIREGALSCCQYQALILTLISCRLHQP